MKYDVLKNCNLSERGLSLSLTRGEVRSDLGGKFSKTYLNWHCEEKLLAISKEITEEATENVTEVTNLPTEDKASVDLGANPDLETDEPEDEDAFPDLGANPDLETDEPEDEDAFPDFESMNVKQIKVYANEHNVDIEGLTRKSDIIDAIIDELAEQE